MDKLLEKYHRVNEGINITSGLVATQALCSRLLLEAESAESTRLILKLMAQIAELSDQATKDTI